MKTPTQFYDEMHKIEVYSEENGVSPLEAGCILMCDMLEELGYDDGVEIFKEALSL